MPREEALRLPIIQINGPRQVRYLVFDVDRPGGGNAWMDANLPVPTLVVSNPRNGHAHLLWELENSVWIPDEGESRSTRYLKAVYEAMRSALGADSGYRGLVAKNPFSPSWRVSYGSLRPYRLAELHVHLELRSPARHARNTETVIGRRSILFDEVRRWAYRNRINFVDKALFHEAITEELCLLNEAFTKGPETPAVIRSTAKSITNWMWEKHSPVDIKNRGVMQLDASLSIHERQRLGQSYTCSIRRDSTLARIRVTLAELLSEGKKITKTAVASKAGVHRHTVRGYWDRLTDILTGTVTRPVTLKEEIERLRRGSLCVPTGHQTRGVTDTLNTPPATDGSNTTLLLCQSPPLEPPENSQSEENMSVDTLYEQ